MENPNQPPVSAESAAPSKLNLHFIPIFKESIALYKKHFLVISGFMLITAIFSLIVEYFFPSDPTMGSSTFYKISAETVTVQSVGIGLVIGIAAMIISYFTYAASLRHLSTEGKVGFSDALQQAVWTLREAIILAIRLFIYTYAWIITILVAVIAISPIIGIEIRLLVAVISIAILILFIFLIKRMIAVSFAFPLFLTEEKMESKQALEQSIVLSKGHLSTIFVNFLLLGIVAAIITFVYGMIIFPLIPTSGITQATYNLSAEALLLPVQIVFASISVTFTYVFMRKAQGK